MTENAVYVYNSINEFVSNDYGTSWEINYSFEYPEWMNEYMRRRAKIQRYKEMIVINEKYLSNDSGKSWTDFSDRQYQDYIIKKVILQKNNLYAQCEKKTGSTISRKLHKSTDNGLTWSLVTEFRSSNEKDRYYVSESGKIIKLNFGELSLLNEKDKTWKYLCRYDQSNQDYNHDLAIADRFVLTLNKNEIKLF